MKNNRNKILVYVFLSACIILNGCSFQEAKVETQQIAEQGLSLEKVVFDPDEYDEDRLFTIYKATDKTIESGAFAELFSAEPDVTDENGYIRLDVPSTGEYGYIVDGNICSCGYLTSVGMEIISQAQTAVNAFGIEYLNDGNSFDFAGRTEVEENLNGILSELGIGLCDYQIYPFTEENFNEIREYYHTNLTGATKEEIRDPFSVYVESYYVHAQPVIDGIKLLDSVVGSPEKGNEIWGTTIDIQYSQDGIETIHISNVYEITEIISQNVPLIPCEEAALTAIGYLENLTLNEEACLISCELAYAPVPNGIMHEDRTYDYYEMTPAWIFKNSSGMTICVNAVTGVRLG